MRLRDYFQFTEQEHPYTHSYFPVQLPAQDPGGTPKQVTQMKTNKHARKPRHSIANAAFLANWGTWPVFITRLYLKIVMQWWKANNVPPDKAFWANKALHYPLTNYNGQSVYVSPAQWFCWFQLRTLQLRGYSWLKWPPSPLPTPSYPFYAWAPPAAPLITGWSEDAPGEYYLDIKTPPTGTAYLAATWWQWLPTQGPTPKPSPRFKGVSSGPFTPDTFQHILITYGGVLPARPTGTKGQFHCAVLETGSNQPSELATTQFSLP